MKNIKSLLTTLLLSFIAISCANNQPTKDDRIKESKNKSIKNIVVAEDLENAISKKDLLQELLKKNNCEILNSKIIENGNRIIRLSIEKPIAKSDLEKLAIALKANNSGGRNTFIFYHIGEPLGMAWATTHFEPNLTVNIKGQTLSQYTKSIDAKSKSDGIEKYYCGSCPLAKTFAFKTIKNQIHGQIIYGDGSGGEWEKLKKYGNGYKFSNYVDEDHLIFKDEKILFYSGGDIYATGTKLKN